MLSDAELDRIAALCAAFDVDGMRADLVLARTAVAHAAWRGATAGASEATGEISVDEQDIRVAAELALPHRRRRDPFDDPGIDPGELDAALDRAGRPGDSGPDREPDPEPPGGGVDSAGSANASAAKTAAPQQNSPAAPRPSAPPAAPFRTRALSVPGIGDGALGRRSPARNSVGAIVGASPTPEQRTRCAPVRHPALRRRPPHRSRALRPRSTTSAGPPGSVGKETW